MAILPYSSGRPIPLPISQGGTGNTTGNAATVTTNANLTGDVTSIGNATTLAATGATAGSYTLTDLTVDAKGRITAASSGTASGTGTVTSVSVVSANGFAGTVATATTTPAITMETSLSGVLKGNGTALLVATSGTDYAPATSGSNVLKGNGSGGFSSAKYTATIGDGTSTSIAVTHSLGTQDVIVQVRDASTNAVVECDITQTSTTVTTFTFAVAPVTNAYKIVIIG